MNAAQTSSLVHVSLAYDDQGIPRPHSRSCLALEEAHITGVREEANAFTYAAIVVAMLGALMFGVDQGNYGLCSEFRSFYDYWCKPRYVAEGYSCEPPTGDDRGRSIPHQDWIFFQSMGGSLITLGAAAGCVCLAPIISSRWGRRPCISLGGVICFFGCLFASYWSANSVTLFYAGRFTTGFGVGLTCFALPLYSSEVATPSVRGLMGSVFQLMVVLGGLIASLILAGVEDWRLGMMLPGLVGVWVGTIIWLTPESPRFLMDRHGYEVGMASLAKVRKGNVESEALAMKAASEAEAQAGQLGYMELFKRPGVRHRVLVACYLQIAQQLTGVNAFLSYTQKIFEAAGIPKDEIDAMPGYAVYFNFSMLVGCIVGLLCIDSKYGGRRWQLLLATLLMGPPLVIAGVARLVGCHLTCNALASILPVGALFLYGPAFQFAWGIVPWIYPAEIFSMAEKDRACSLATFFVFAVNFAINFITPHLLSWSAGGTFVFFGILNASNFMFALLFVKETKGVALENIPALFTRQSSRTRGILGMSLAAD